MSKNFELMQRAGKLLEIELPRPVEPASAPVERPTASVIPPVDAPAPSSFSTTLAPPASHAIRRGTRGRHAAIDHVAREESHRLVQQIFLTRAQDAPRVVVFAAMDHGNGCSRICANTAEALQEAVRGTICIVEANFRSPSLPDMYGVTNHYGLTNALLGEGPMKSFAKPVRGNNLYLLSCGSLASNSQSLLSSDRLRTRFRELRNEFDFIIVDAPPLNRYSDALAVAKVADGFVLVLEANATKREAAVRASEQLRASQVRILGAVLNKRTYPIPDALYRRL